MRFWASQANSCSLSTRRTSFSVSSRAAAGSSERADVFTFRESRPLHVFHRYEDQAGFPRFGGAVFSSASNIAHSCQRKKKMDDEDGRSPTTEEVRQAALREHGLEDESGGRVRREFGSLAALGEDMFGDQGNEDQRGEHLPSDGTATGEGHAPPPAQGSQTVAVNLPAPDFGHLEASTTTTDGVRLRAAPEGSILPIVLNNEHSRGEDGRDVPRWVLDASGPGSQDPATAMNRGTRETSDSVPRDASAAVGRRLASVWRGLLVVLALFSFTAFAKFLFTDKSGEKKTFLQEIIVPLGQGVTTVTISLVKFLEILTLLGNAVERAAFRTLGIGAVAVGLFQRGACYVAVTAVMILLPIWCCGWRGRHRPRAVL
ncbi:unnamed protein product [Amoebophrya sp. A120]|nr:unnamed protein product [Amoebophrya sp. A120]|eukprot:GSA120T00002028001.1